MKTIIKKIVLAAGILVLATAIAGADDVDRALSDIAPQAVVQSTRALIESGLASERAIAVTRAMVQNRFEAQQIARAHQVMLDAQAQGLPPDPIINKAFEGMAKQVQSGRIVNAMDTVRVRYDFAYKQAAKLTDRQAQMNQIGHVIAACLTAGLGSKSVESITHGLQDQMRTLKTDEQDILAMETFKTARDMARLGVSPSQTEALIHQALEHQFSAAQMHNMRTAFRNDSRTTPSQSVAARYSRSIEQGKSFESPGGGQKGAGQSSESSGAAGNAPGGSGPGGGSGSGSGGGSGPGGSGPGGGSGSGS
jgi:hypothetical protein